MDSIIFFQKLPDESGAVFKIIRLKGGITYQRKWQSFPFFRLKTDPVVVTAAVRTVKKVGCTGRNQNTRSCFHRIMHIMNPVFAVLSQQVKHIAVLSGWTGKGKASFGSSGITAFLNVHDFMSFMS